MERQLVKDLVYDRHWDGFPIIRFKDILFKIEPDDIIEIERVPEAYYSDSSNDAYTTLRIYRERLQTDEEFEKSKKKFEERAAQSKKQRYENYLKLKKEFDIDN